MGFQDRDYNRHEPYDDNGYRRRGGPMSVTMRLVILNVALWLANGLFFSETNLLAGLMAIVPNTIKHPEYWWKFLTYGFAHSPGNPMHIFGNMLALIMFGYGMMLGIGPGGFGLVRGENVEQRLGRGEYFIFYILSIVVSGFVYGFVHPDSACLGASGGVTAIVILYALLYPKKVLLLWGILPLPMWAIGLLIVYMDASGSSGDNVAYTAHLAGAGFALLYYFLFLSRDARITGIFSVFGHSFKRKPKLNIYSGDEKPRERKSAKDEEFEKRLDEILDRYGKVGESGLTSEEREFLKRASKKYQDKK